MHPEQEITYMAEGVSQEATVFVSTTRFSRPGGPPLPSQRWETLVGYIKEDTTLSLFDNFPTSIAEFCPMYCSAHLLGSNRDLQHEYAVDQLKKQGYSIVMHKDNREFWSEQLEGILGLDFTPAELNRIEFLRYLRNQGKI